jgi:hypothetical protein
LTHGGEVIAVRSFMNSRPVSQHMIDEIVSYFMTVCRFVSRIVSFRQVDVLFITAYFWVGEGFSERNITILKQIYMLHSLSLTHRFAIRFDG